MVDILLVMAFANSHFLVSLPLLLLGNQILIASNIMTDSSQNTTFKLSVSLLQAYEDRTPPPGAPTNHPVGHAVVRFRIENLTQNNTIANITKIEICQPNNHKILMSQTVNPFALGGLQILEQGFHLTNAKGFADSEELKAVATYQLNNKIYTVESPNVKVVLNP